MTGAAVLAGLVILAGLGVWRFRWLTTRGALAALGVGAAVLAGSGVGGLGLLLFFFVTSSLLTGYRSDAKSAARARADRAGPGGAPEGDAPEAGAPGGGAPGGTQTGSARDHRSRSAAQVLANGGVAAAASLLGLAGWAAGAQLAFVGALAAATADTWATEVGTAGRWPTRRLIGWDPVAPGTSGGVSGPGTLAGVAGALLCGGCGGFLLQAPSAGAVLAGVGGGVAGMVADSALGATVEERLGWVTNDVVNLAGTLVGAAGGWALAVGVGG